MTAEEGPTYTLQENGFMHYGEICSVFQFPLDDFAGMWFRGQECCEWKLQPSLLRRAEEFGYDNVVAVEPTLNREFKRNAVRYFSGQRSAVEIYIGAQHAGFPTRLLDWSANPLAALFFAVEEIGTRSCKGATLFALDVAHLDAILDEESPRFADACAQLFQSQSAGGPLFEKDSPRVPLAIEPDIREGRMTQQASRFTFHFGLAKWPRRSIRTWFIPRSAKEAIRDELNALNVNRATLFPDLDNLARHYAKGLDPDLRSYVFGKSVDDLFENPIKPP